MQRITTANRSIDKFGAGKDGFAGDPNATDLEPAWCDAVQEELARCVEDQGEALDPGDLGQLAAALNSWGWSGTPTVKSGATFTVASGGFFNASAGSSVSFSGSVVFNSGASFVASCDVTFNEDVTIGSAGTDTLDVKATIDANSSSPSLNVTNSGTGIGVSSIVSNDNYAAYFQSDTTSPVKAAVHITPQDADPSSPSTGDFFHSSERKKMRTRTISGWESLHSSSKGYIFGFAAGTSGTNVNSGDIAQFDISPEVVGDVLVTATGYFEMADSADSYTIVLRDVTANVTIDSVIVDHGVGGEGALASFRAVYTLPFAGFREFAFQVNGNGGGTVTRSKCVLSVHGIK